jgi:hypothetical protein
MDKLLGALRGATAGILAVLIVGAIKEVYDGATGRGVLDVWDFFATLAGGLIGLACSWIGF